MFRIYSARLIDGVRDGVLGEGDVLGDVLGGYLARAAWRTSVAHASRKLGL